jgi:hypothetical protein
MKKGTATLRANAYQSGPISGRADSKLTCAVVFPTFGAPGCGYCAGIG